MNRIHKIPLYPIILGSPLSVKGRINAQQINCKTFVFRRMREVISNKVLEVTQGSENIKVMLAGLSNVYTHYITTWEEYQR